MTLPCRPASALPLAALLLALSVCAASARPARPVGDIGVKTWPDSVILTFRFDGDIAYRRLPAGEGEGVLVEGAHLDGPALVKRIDRPPVERVRVTARPEGGMAITLHPGDGILLETGRRKVGRETELQLFAYLPRPGESFPATRRAAERARAAGRPVVVIDPGHGGIDSGTAHGGLLEKKINLSVARAAARRMRAHGGVHAVMTRSADRYVTLSRRRHEATLLSADLFLSFHVNANADARCFGIEIYRPSTGGARDRAQSLLEDRENMSMPGDEGLPVPDPTLAGILVDLKRERVMRDAAIAAEALRRRLAALAGSASAVKVKSGDFRVINNLDTPSLLLELGFLTNAGDRALLADPAFRAALGEAVAGAVLDHFGLPEGGVELSGKPSGNGFRIVRIEEGDTFDTVARAAGITSAEVRRIAGKTPLSPGRALVLPAR